MQDESIFERVLGIENKDVFVDLKSNKGGMYLKISERKNGKGDLLFCTIDINVY